MQIRVYLSEGREIDFTDVKETLLTSVSMIVYGKIREGVDLESPLLGEFYREAIAGYKRTDL